MTAVLDPASAIAAGLCMTARTIAVGVTERHRTTCGWCDYPLDGLRQMIDGFNAWAGHDERRGTYREHEARVFQGLPRAEQRRLVEIAQAFAEPLQPSQPPPADAAEETAVRPSWMPL